MKVGVLALQGNFALHEKRIIELGAESCQVRHQRELDSIEALIIPGGESTTLLRLMEPSMRQVLAARVEEGLPLLVTCAGLILVAEHVFSPKQESLGLLDVDVERNSYGRQIDSFVEESLQWTSEGRKCYLEMSLGRTSREAASPVEGIFIRAPRITRVGPQVEVLIERNQEPVLVKQGNILGATFHPELSDKAQAVHNMLLALVSNNSGADRLHLHSA